MQLEGIFLWVWAGKIIIALLRSKLVCALEFLFCPPMSIFPPRVLYLLFNFAGPWCWRLVSPFNYISKLFGKTGMRCFYAAIRYVEWHHGLSCEPPPLPDILPLQQFKRRGPHPYPIASLPSSLTLRTKMQKADKENTIFSSCCSRQTNSPFFVQSFCFAFSPWPGDPEAFSN